MVSQDVSMKRRKVLVVDDESSITRTLRASFLANGYDVRTAQDGISGLQVLEDWGPELIITDLAMPEMDGIELCRRVRAFSSIPIILLSVQEDITSKIAALDAGADDYVTKPFSIDELLARVRTALRRLDLIQTFAMPAVDQKMLDIGDFSVNLLTRQVMIRDVEVRLTPREYELLVFFLRNADRVLTHSFVIKSVWGAHTTHQPEYLRVVVAALRKKIEPDPNHPRYLLTDPWVGYRFTPVEEEA
ncbi:MAG: response regulator transcription factor [Acidobacteriales bacterium]|nr:response regulator transcription factor [Terriglobales bacterium]